MEETQLLSEGCFDGLSKQDISVTGNLHTELINS